MRSFVASPMHRGDYRLRPNLYDNVLSLMVAGPDAAYPKLDWRPGKGSMIDNVREARDAWLTFRLRVHPKYFGAPNWPG